MSQFLERNKKKGILAGLLLLLKKGRGAGPIVAMTTLLAFVFIVPAGYSGLLPGLNSLAERFGVAGLFGPPSTPGFETLREGFGSARPRADAPAGAPGLRGAGGIGGYGRSSIGYVQGRDVLPKAGDNELGDSVAKAGGKTVEGVLTPEDAKKMGQGVALREEELHSGLTNVNALAGVSGGVFAGEMGIKERASGSSGGVSGGGSRGRADDRSANMLASAMQGSLVPSVGTSGSRAGARERMRGGRRALMSAGPDLANRTGPNSVFFQLAEARAYGIAAAPPPGYCPPGNCPNEFASNASGAPFDGKKPPTGQILAAEELGDPGVPVTPDAGQIGTLTDEATNLEQDAKKCEEAEAVYGPQERAKMDEIHKLSCRLSTDATQSGDCVGIEPLQCNHGGCSASKAKACKAVGDEMKMKCQEYNTIAQQKAAACPLTNGRYSSMDCNGYY